MTVAEAVRERYLDCLSTSADIGYLDENCLLRCGKIYNNGEIITRQQCEYTIKCPIDVNQKEK